MESLPEGPLALAGLVKPPAPLLVCGATPVQSGSEEVINRVVDPEVRVDGVAHHLLGHLDLIVPQWLAMRGRGVLEIGGAVSDVCAADDQGGAVLLGEGLLDGLAYGLPVVTVDSHGVPPQRREPLGDVLAEGDLG